MKHLKKLLALILALSMVFSMGLTVFAEEEYYYYKVKLTTQLNTDDHPYIDVSYCPFIWDDTEDADIFVDPETEYYRIPDGTSRVTGYTYFYSQKPISKILFKQFTAGDDEWAYDVEKEYIAIIDAAAQKTGKENAAVIDEMQILGYDEETGEEIYSEPMEPVYSLDYFPMPNVHIQGNDGRFVVTAAFDDNPWESDGYGIYVKDNETVRNNGITVSDPVFWDPDRGFEGWEVLCWTTITEGEESWEDWVRIPGSAILTTAEMLDYEKPSDYDEIMFCAVWKGEESDYYTNVGFHNFDGSITLVHNDLTEEHEHGFGQRFREGYSPKEQNDKFEIINISSDHNYTFEGWICIETETGAILAAEGEEYALFTTEEVVSEKVPENEIDYFVKWKEIPIDDYLSGSGEGPEGSEGPSPDDNVFFDCYGGRFVITDGQETIDTDLYSGYLEKDECINDQNVYIETGFPEKQIGPNQYATFEGWIKFNMDEEKFVDTTKLWSNAEIILKPQPEYKVCYIAKWDDVPLSQYVYGESHETVGSRNIGFYGNGGRNKDILINQNGENEGGSSLITQWGVAEGKTLNEVIKEDGYFKEVNFIPYKNGERSESWTLVEADSIMWKEYILGTTFTPAANQEILYEEVLGAYQRYLVAENARIYKEDALTSEIFELGGNYSYFAIANWGTRTPVEIEGNEGNFELVENSTVKVPENLPEDKKDKFSDPEKIKDEFEKEFGNKGHKKENTKFKFVEVTLMAENEEGELVPVEVSEVTQHGINIIISYPEGITQENADDYVFVIAHLNDNGEIEIFEDYDLTEDGIRIKVKDLSPFAIAYTEKTNESEDPEDPKVPEDPEKPGILPEINIKDFIEEIFDRENSKKDEKEPVKDIEDEENPNTGAPVFLGR